MPALDTATRILISSGRVIDPANNTDAVQNIYIADGKVIAFGNAPQGFKADIEIDASHRIVCPGLIDLHTHLPQYPVVARREDSLLPWLQRHIFPTELEFQGPGQRAMIEAFFDDLALNGTSTAVLYSAIWEDSTRLAFEVARERGLRVVVGKMMMTDSTEKSKWVTATCFPSRLALRLANSAVAQVPTAPPIPIGIAASSVNMP